VPSVQIPPRVTETNVEAWAHCSNPRCSGNGQQAVSGVRVLSEYTIGSRGGDGIFVQLVENSSEYVRFADPDEVECGVCGGAREISEQRRPVIPIISGFPQDGLLGAPKFDPSLKFSDADQAASEAAAAQAKEIAELKATVAALAEKLA
jgi:hypothetical protein